MTRHALWPIAQQVNAERLVLLGWSRAILLQLAHPLVAAGVADHSTFRATPLAAAARLHHTVAAMRALIFGTPAQRDEAVERIRAIHRRVNGRLSAAVGPFPAGTPYSAEDPALLLWVHATLLESFPLVYERLVRPLTDAERDAYCAEAVESAVALGARETEVPRTSETLHRYLRERYASGEIVVGPQAREVAAAVLRPPFAAAIAPIAAVNRLVTIGLLPPDIRDQYGFAWSASDARRLERVERNLRRVRRLTPDLVALWPDARRSRPPKSAVPSST